MIKAYTDASEMREMSRVKF